MDLCDPKTPSPCNRRILAEHKAEELIHHKPPPPRRFRPWLVGTLGFAAACAANRADQ